MRPVDAAIVLHRIGAAGAAQFFIIEGGSAGAEIGPGTEGTATAGDDDGLHLIIGIGLIERGDDFGHHHAGEGVQFLRTVERDGGDGPVDMEGDLGIGHVKAPR